MNLTLPSLIKKWAIALLASLFILCAPTFAQEENNNDFVSASLQVLNLNDFKVREILKMQLTAEDDRTKTDIDLKINALGNLHRKSLLNLDTSTQANIDLKIEVLEAPILRENVFEESQDTEISETQELLVNLNLQGVIQMVIKDNQAYIKLSGANVDYQLAENEMSEFIEPQIESFKNFLENMSGNWYQLPEENTQNSLFSMFYWEILDSETGNIDQKALEKLIETNLEEVLAGNKDWKEGLKTILGELITETYSGYSGGEYEEEKMQFMEAVDEILNSNLFSKREIILGRYAGDTSFILSKPSLVSLFKNLSLIFEGEINEEEVEMFKDIIYNTFFTGRFNIDEETGLPDYFVAYFRGNNIINLDELKVLYGYKLFDVGEVNTIIEPTNIQGVQSLESMFYEMLGLDYSDDYDYYGAYSYCTIHEVSSVSDENDLGKYYVDCGSEDEEILVYSLRFYLKEFKNQEGLTLGITHLPEGEAYYECNVIADNKMECNEIEAEEHDEVYEMDYSAASIDCYKNENGVYECENDPYYDSSFTPNEAYEYCFIKTYNNAQYLDCSGNQKGMLRGSLEAYLGETSSNFEVTYLEDGRNYFVCQNNSCVEITQNEHDKIYDLNYSNERVFDCYGTDFLDEDEEMLFECEEDISYDFTEVCYIQKIGNQHYVDCSVPPNSIVESALEAYEGKDLNLTVNHGEGLWHYYICENSVCNEVSEEDFYDQNYSGPSDDIEAERVFDCTREGTEYICVEDENY